MVWLVYIIVTVSKFVLFFFTCDVRLRQGDISS